MSFITKYRENGKPEYLTMGLKKLNKLIKPALDFLNENGVATEGITDKGHCIQQAKTIIDELEKKGKVSTNDKNKSFIKNKTGLLGDETWVKWQKENKEAQFDNFTNNLFNAEIDTIRDLFPID